MTRMPIGRSAISSLAIVAIWLLLAGLVHAQERSRATIDLTSPEEGAVGQEMTIMARLTGEAGAPIEGAEIVFQASVTFFNTASDIDLGRVKTNALGVATLSYFPLSEGDIEILAIFDATALYSSAFAAASVFVQTGPPQYTEEAGIGVPGINVSLLAALLGTVWGLYFLVMIRVFFIARGEPMTTEPGGEQ